MNLRLVIVAAIILSCRFADGISPKAANPPVIDEQPIGRVVSVGGFATLSVLAHGTAPLTFQWWNSTQPLANNTRVSGATNAVLNIDPVQLGDTTNYFAVVTSSGISVTSSVVSLLVTQLLNGVIPTSTGSFVHVLGQRGDVYRIESCPDFLFFTYTTNGYTTNRTGDAVFFDPNTGPQRYYRGRLQSMLPVVYPPSPQDTQSVLRAYGKLNQGWRFETTTNFVNWTNLATITNTTGWVKFTDTNSPRPLNRFYRISPP